MTTRRLIVNADDCNLTPGVTRGILLAHDRGVVTSTTVLMNLPLEERTLKALRQRKNLGLGLHLNVTLGRPLTYLSRIPSLVKGAGWFRRPTDYSKRMPIGKEVVQEYEAQIRLFEKRFGRKPDHLDTHHHLHNHPPFFSAISEVARRWKIPIRRSRIFQYKTAPSPLSSPPERGRGKGEGVKMELLKTTDYLFGNLETHSYWQRESLIGILENLPEGTSEIACHPGFCDRELREISSFREVRKKELKLFSDRRIRKEVSSLGIDLIRFIDI